MTKGTPHPMNALPINESKLTVLVHSQADMELQLESAAARLIDRATIQGDRGILITRRSPNEFSLELHPSVPFGMTREADAWLGRKEEGFQPVGPTILVRKLQESPS